MRSIVPALTRAIGSCALAASVFAAHGAAASSCVSETFDQVTPPALPIGWQSKTILGSTDNPGWISRSVGYASSAPNALWVDDRDDYADISLLSPAYAVVAATPAISFRQSYTLWAPLNSTQYNGAYSGAVLEVASNHGPYLDVVSAGGTITTSGYSQNLDPDFQNPLTAVGAANRPVWSGTSAGFVTTHVTLSPATVGQQVQFRWRLGTPGGGRAHATYAGWWIDNFEIQGLGDVIFRDGFEGGVVCNS